VIVVDLGCKSHENERSIEPLIERFRPQVLFGFDPHPELQVGITMNGYTTIMCSRIAAWTVAFRTSYLQDGSASRINPAGDMRVETFDLAAWLKTLPAIPVVLKMDVEGAEHVLLPHLHTTDADKLLDLILVEWHGEPVDYGLACQVELWP
jgi:hypothetical protein